MESSITEKFKNNLAALFAGAIASGAVVWSVADNLHKKEVVILERGQAEIQKRLSEAEALLKAAQQVSTKSSAPESKDLSSTRKQEIETMIQKLDAEIKAKKIELARSAGMTDQPKDDFYMRIKDELRSLQQQRDSARLRLIQVLGG